MALTSPSWWPRSLLAQVLLAVTLALLAGQAISAVLLWQAAQARRDAAMLNVAALQLVREAEPLPAERWAQRRDRYLRRFGGEAGSPIDRFSTGRPFPLRIEWTNIPLILKGERRDKRRERELEAMLASQGVPVLHAFVLERQAAADPALQSRPRLLARVTAAGEEDRVVLVAGIQRAAGAPWAIARVPQPRTSGAALQTIAVQTLVILAVLVGALFLLLRRITRPLAALTRRTESFANTAEAGQPLEPHGPDDVSRLIAAHNRMETRIEALLNEKDVMLGAIGHDLKTPLAALRVRIESVEDDGERAKMAASIEDITRSLDDILSLARIGRTREAAEKTDLSSLTASVVEEFEDMGDNVTLEESARIVRPVHVTWLRRALRNLISNAVRYAGGATVRLSENGGTTSLIVEDTGPGIAPERIAEMMEPFTRGEASRNRETGGAGLGLTLARAIAEQHGGTLTLTNRAEGGLRAEIVLPPAHEAANA